MQLRSLPPKKRTGAINTERLSPQINNPIEKNVSEELSSPIPGFETTPTKGISTLLTYCLDKIESTAASDRIVMFGSGVKRYTSRDDRVRNWGFIL